MIEEATKEKPAVVPKPVPEDLSKQIEQSVERQPDERLKVVRVFGNFYRCNWWVQDISPTSFWLSTGTIRKSRLLKATKTNDGVLVEDVTLSGKQK